MTGFLILLECAALVLGSAVAVVLNNENNLVKSAESTAAQITAHAGDLKLITDTNVNVYNEDKRWKGPVLSKGRGTIMGPSGKETYYNLNMAGVVNIMRRMGNEDEYWVRDDGCKMLGDYIMVAANLNVHPRGSLVDISLGKAIVCDTGGFAARNPYQIDVAVKNSPH